MRKEQVGKANQRYELPIHVKRQEILVLQFLRACETHLDLPHNIYNKKRGEHYLVQNKLPDKLKADYIITAENMDGSDYGKMLAVAECKWYFKSWQSWDYTIKLSLKKIKDVIDLADTIKARPFFLIRMVDGFFYWIPSVDYLCTARMIIGGRTDRGQAGDLEPMIIVPERYWYPYHLGESSND